MANKHISEMLSNNRLNVSRKILCLHHQELAKLPNRNKAESYKIKQCLRREIHRRRQAEEQIKIYEKRVCALSHQFAIMEDLQRRSIASDLHDSAIQSLAGAQIKLGALRKFTSKTDLKALIDDIRGQVDQTIDDIRTLIFKIEPPILEEEGLEAALKWLVDKKSKQYGVKIIFSPDGRLNLPEGYLQTFCYRSIREFILNSVKHARANIIKLSIRKTGCRLRFDIIDDGIGFNANDISSYARNGHFGLYYMIKRVKQYEGYLNIQSQPGKGTHISLIMPLLGENDVAVNEEWNYEDKNTCSR
ncbi:MAG: sensor histidine kinase [Proteobacteria bacterium]|nr:sensor histidine kinase [Pseudomonadota bacterium]